MDLQIWIRASSIEMISLMPELVSFPKTIPSGYPHCFLCKAALLYHSPRSVSEGILNAPAKCMQREELVITKSAADTSAADFLTLNFLQSYF